MEGCQVMIELYKLIVDRKSRGPPNSYTSRLLSQGLNAIAKKIGEESAEVVLAAARGDRDEVVNEVSDLIYHVLVLLAYLNVDLEMIFAELKRRRGVR